MIDACILGARPLFGREDFPATLLFGRGRGGLYAALFHQLRKERLETHDEFLFGEDFILAVSF